VAQQGWGNLVNSLQSLLTGGTGLINAGTAGTAAGGNILGTGANVLTGF
jgi:hypothetical protein